MKKPTKSEMKMALRQEAKRKVPGGSFGAGTNLKYRDAVEAGRKQLLIKSSQGGDSSAKKAKNELNYLLNNYAPRYDTRIEHLIDIWRRSGDPEYDPGIRIRLRQAQKEHMRKANPV